jgi:2-polyprenyl-6-hydroxyphenyl methylase/3-demethylubiquinone-9 3-methyltransferase
VVTAGEILEHVTDLSRALAEACRLLRPGGTLVIDTIASTWLARLIAVEIGERIPGGAPPGIHDPALFVNRDYLVGCCAANGVQLTLRGLRPSAIEMIGWLARRRDQARMVKTASTAVLFQGVGVKEQR